jgi:hypothetical protein
MLPSLLTITLSTGMYAADGNQATFIDPAKAGPDFALQGEYEAAAAD